jgi:hypothetical protein
LISYLETTNLSIFMNEFSIWNQYEKNEIITIGRYVEQNESSKKLILLMTVMDENQGI